MITTANTLPDDISQLKGIIAEQVLNQQKYEKDIERHREEVARKFFTLARHFVHLHLREPVRHPQMPS